MKKLLLAVAGLAFLSAGALAADLPAPAPMTYKAPVVVPPAASWTGFYLNAGGGYGMWSADTYIANPAGGAPIIGGDQIQGGRGYLGVLGGGYDLQLGGLGIGNWNPPVLIGIQADYDPSSIKGTIQDQGPFVAGNIKENYSWSVGARAGLIIFPQMLTYVNGGYTSGHFDGTTLTNTISGLPSGLVTPGFRTNGWFAGGGTETTLSPLLPSGWFLRSEYRYNYFQSETIPENPVAGGAATRAIAFHPTEQTLTTSLIYKFNWH
jgi:outer membrane immunogenic protein